MAYVQDFEGCCTAKVIVDLGGSNTSEFGYSPVDYAKLRKDIINCVKEVQDDRCGIVTAIVTSEQVTGQKVLKDLGFTGTGMAKKSRHNEVDIELYYLHCKDWEVPEQPADIVAPPPPVAAPQPFAAARRADPQPAPVQRPRNAQGRFVAPQFEEGVAFFQTMDQRSRYVQSTNRAHSANYVNSRNLAKVFTRAEFNELTRLRAGLGYKELTFQPI